jgi:hypothetical protein
MDLLLQSWGGKIRVFPAMPGDWKSSSFHQLRAMDGFLVSANRKDGRTEWIHLASEAGEPCVIRVPDWKGPLQVTGSRPHTATETAPGEWKVDLKKGENVLIHPAGAKVTPVIAPLPVKPDEMNLYGVRKGGEIKKIQAWPELPLPK